LFVFCGAESQVTGVLARGTKRWSPRWIFCSTAVVQGLGFLSFMFALRQVRLCEEVGIVLKPSVQRIEFFFVLVVLSWWLLVHERKVFSEMCVRQ
jgi:hypothetical protein